MPTDSYLELRRSGYVATISHQNPPRHTIDGSGSEELLVLLENLAEDSSIRVIVLTGGSDDIFIRHFEVDELASSAERIQQGGGGSTSTGTPKTPSKPRGLRGVLATLESVDQVTIAAINGMAMGGGLEIALACDFRLAREGDDFRLGLPETGVGILPGGGGTQRFARLLGVAKALDLILHGTTFTPTEALSLGVVSRLFAQDLPTYRKQVDAFAENLALRAPRALANAKRAIREGVELPLEEGMRREAELFAELMRTEDAAKALRAAFDGEPLPEFEGR